MAKLNAHGIQLLVLQRTTVPTTVDSLTISDRETVAYMSDGAIMRKVDVVFKPGPFDPPAGRKHSYGWKLFKRTGVKGERWLAHLRSIVERNNTFVQPFEILVNSIPEGTTVSALTHDAR
jgi:hypothetical protein